jgi:hypothetical protein
MHDPFRAEWFTPSPENHGTPPCLSILILAEKNGTPHGRNQGAIGHMPVKND